MNNPIPQLRARRIEVRRWSPDGHHKVIETFAAGEFEAAYKKAEDLALAKPGTRFQVIECAPGREVFFCSLVR